MGGPRGSEGFTSGPDRMSMTRGERQHEREEKEQLEQRLSLVEQLILELG